MTQRKAKRKLSDIDFSKEGSHIALVSKEQGHGANGHHYALVMKATNYSEAFLEKASKITVEMDIVEYLTRFYGLWQTDAELLARSLGFTTPGMEKAVLEQAEQMLEDKEPPEAPDWESEPGDTEYEKWINYKLQSIQVMKSLYESENITETLASLSEDEYLQLLQDQQQVEKVLKKIDEENVQKACGTKGKKPVKKSIVKESTNVAKATEDDTSTINVDVEKSEGVDSPVVKQANKETKNMTKEVHVVEREVELVEKAALVELQKALDAQKEELQKAKDTIEQFKQAEKERIAKARKEQVEAAVGDKVQAEVIAKAALLVEDEAEFQEVLKALSAVAEKAKAAADELFVEKGASAEVKEDGEQGNAVANILKAKFAK